MAKLVLTPKRKHYYSTGDNVFVIIKPAIESNICGIPAITFVKVTHHVHSISLQL
jgi:hypothetical protein